MFKLPVNPYSLKCFNYWEQVPYPMDLKTIKHKFYLKKYKVPEDFNSDMNLMF